jgi:large subunit ribosomal protein L21
MASTYAVVETGGKQYRAEKGAILLVDRISEDEGAKVALRPVMFRGDKQVVLEPSELAKVKVEAVVAGHERGPKIRIFKYRAKKGYRRRGGHRSELTRLEVTDVKLLSRKPAAQKKSEGAKSKPAAKPKPKSAAKPKARARKPAAKPKPKSTRKTGASSRSSSGSRRSSSAKKDS